MKVHTGLQHETMSCDNLLPGVTCELETIFWYCKTSSIVALTQHTEASLWTARGQQIDRFKENTGGYDLTDFYPHKSYTQR